MTNKRNNISSSTKQNQCIFSVLLKKDLDGNFGVFNPNMSESLPAKLVIAVTTAIVESVDNYNNNRNS